MSREKRDSLDLSIKLDEELFPIIKEGKIEAILYNLEERLLKLPKQRLISERFTQLIARFEDIVPRLPENSGKSQEAKSILADLRTKQKALQVCVFSESLSQIVFPVCQVFFLDW